MELLNNRPFRIVFLKVWEYQKNRNDSSLYQEIESAQATEMCGLYLLLLILCPDFHTDLFILWVGVGGQLTEVDSFPSAVWDEGNQMQAVRLCGKCP